ncbi:hypothetical protein M8C13_32745 [Crossiella sp. SN42]|uniref:hypothetical protein n=1 Tax=Crossiella sp. SN42 TaxID=2944808 RepID=UPI00207C6D86|nr:hypothetical protein [Crossiella sp. SN42]MCO1580534.1 hypothetical protein [Crossiella sp. SN42]
MLGLLLLADHTFATEPSLRRRRQLHEAAHRCAAGPSRRPRVVLAEPLGVAWQEQHDVEQCGSRCRGRLLHVRGTQPSPVTGTVLRHLDAVHAERLPHPALSWSRACWDRLAVSWANTGAIGTAMFTVILPAGHCSP